MEEGDAKNPSDPVGNLHVGNAPRRGIPARSRVPRRASKASYQEGRKRYSYRKKKKREREKERREKRMYVDEISLLSEKAE